MRGAAFILLALILLGAVLWHLLAVRGQELARLDSRLSRHAPDGAMMAPRLRAPMPVPALVMPLLAQAQIDLSMRAIGLCAGGSVLLAVGALLLAGPVWALGFLAGPPLAALLYVRHRARKRIDALIEALPYYIDTVRQMQMVGNSLGQALERALYEAPAIVKSYMAPVVRRLELGAPVGEAIELLAARLRVPEISMLAAAIRTNMRYGGSIAAVLTNLAAILRSRIRVKRELDAATAQARVSARVLIAMPIVALVLLVVLNPAYPDFFLGDPRGHVMVIVAVGLQAMGMIAMNRLMRLAF